MTLVAADLLKPDGLIDAKAFYPSLDDSAVATLLDTYLAAGYDKATAAVVANPALVLDDDEVAEKYAYYKAWDDVVVRYYSTPTSVALAGELSASFSGQQLSYWLAGRDQWEAAYLALIPDPTVQLQPRPRTTSVPNTFRF